MNKGFNISAQRMIAGEGAAPKSARARNANLSNRWAMACSGARVAQRYVTALNSGGLTAPRPAGR